jgi:hypothetical protein
VFLNFQLLRPKSVDPLKRPWPITRPDIDKLERTVLDHLTSVGLIDDDSQVCLLCSTKSYGEPGVEIVVVPLDRFASDGKRPELAALLLGAQNVLDAGEVMRQVSTAR